jgi:hypothetical protein
MLKEHNKQISYNWNDIVSPVSNAAVMYQQIEMAAALKIMLSDNF